MSAPNAATAATATVITYDICPDCDGEGSHLHIGAPGWYDPRQQAWYPSETDVPCQTCGGSGRTEIHLPTDPPTPRAGTTPVPIDEDLPF